MENQIIKLPQLDNTIEVVGVLKSHNLEVKTSAAGNTYIKGQAVVTVKDEDKINDIRIEVFMMESSSLYKGIHTVMDEYKTVDKDGSEADRVKITCNISLNEYKKNGALIQQNQLKGVFFNRVGMEVKDQAQGKIVTIVEGIADQEDGTGLLRAFTVGWGPEIIPMLKTIVPRHLVDAARGLFVMSNQTHEIDVKINNYVSVDENDMIEEAPTMGFGVEANVENRSKTYINNIEIIGASGVIMDASAYDENQIAEAKKVRQAALNTLDAPTSKTPATPPRANALLPNDKKDDTPTGAVKTEVPNVPSADDDVPAF